MAISVVLISSDSLEESMGTSTAQVILFGMIPTAILTIIPIVDPPVVHDDTLLILTETPTITHRHRSLVVSVPLATPVPGALSPVRVNLLAPRNRIRGVVTAYDYDDSTEESYEAYLEPNIDSNVQADIDADTAAAEAVATREEDVRVKVGSGRLGCGKRQHETARDVVYRERERVDSLRCHMSYTQDELRQIRVSRYNDRAEFRRLKTSAIRHLALEAYQNRKPIRENGDGPKDDNGDDNGNGNGDGGRNDNRNGLGGGNGNGNLNVNIGGTVPVAQECTC
nr:hypothetical protein [Tanacetum cinerariifolium]